MAETVTSSSNSPATAPLPPAPQRPSPKSSIELPPGPQDRGEGDDQSPGSVGELLARAKEFMKGNGVEDPTANTPFNKDDPLSFRVDPAAEAAKEAAAKKAGKQPTDDSKPPTGPGSHKRWDELKAKEKRLAEVEREREELAKQAQELKAWREQREKEQSISKEEFERIKKEREELAAEMRVVDITRDPEFRREIDEPIKRTYAEAMEFVPDEAKNAAMAALFAPSKVQQHKILAQIKESGKLEEYQIDALKDYCAQMFPLQQRRQSLIANAQEVATKREMEIAERTKNEAKQRESLFESQLNEAMSEETLAPMLRGDNEETKKLAANRVREIREFWSAMDDPENRARAAIWSRIGPDLHREVAALRKQIADLSARKDKVKSLGDVSPNPTEMGSIGDSVSTSGDDDLDMSAQAIARRMGNFRFQ